MYGIELERERNDVLIIAHHALLRPLYAYFVDAPLSKVPYLNIPEDTGESHKSYSSGRSHMLVIQLTPKAYGCEEVRIKLTGEGANVPFKARWTLVRPRVLKKGRADSIIGMHLLGAWTSHTQLQNCAKAIAGIQN